MHTSYNRQVFIKEQEEYEDQNIVWDPMVFQNNADVIELLAGKKTGLFPLLDNQAMLGDRGSDDGWLASVNRVHLKKDAKRYTRPKVAPEDKFCVTHYAHRVTYRAEGCVSRNNDALEHDLSALPLASSVALMPELFGGRSGAPAPPKKAQHKMANVETVSKRFREEMAALMKQLEATQPHFIRCVKPNAEKKAAAFDSPMVLHQLKYG